MLVHKENITKFLPHRHPFLFIDAVESITLEDEAEKKFQSGERLEPKDLMGSVVLAHFYVDPGMDILRGHFPGNPILPGVIQIEMMAQASCFALMKLMKDPYNVELNVALVKVEESKFRKPVRPGMHLKLQAICRKQRGPMMSYECQISHENEILSEATLMATASFKE